MLTAVFNAVLLALCAFCFAIMSPVTERRAAEGDMARAMEKQLAAAREDVERAARAVVKDGAIPAASQWGFQHTLNQFLAGLVIPGRVDTLHVLDAERCGVLASASARPVDADFCQPPLASDRVKGFAWWRAKDGGLLFGQVLAMPRSEGGNATVVAALRLDHDWLAKLPHWRKYDALFRPAWRESARGDAAHQAPLPLAAVDEDLLRHGRLVSQDELSFWLAPLVHAAPYDPASAVVGSALLFGLGLWWARRGRERKRRADEAAVAAFIGQCLAMDKGLPMPQGRGVERLVPLAQSLAASLESWREKLHAAREKESQLRQRVTALENDAIQMEEELKKEADAHHAFRLAREGVAPLHGALARAEAMAWKLEELMGEALMRPLRRGHMTLADWVEQMADGNARKLLKSFLDDAAEGGENVFQRDAEALNRDTATAIRAVLGVQDELAVLHLELSEALAKAAVVRDSLNLEGGDEGRYPVLASIRFCERLMAVSLDRPDIAIDVDVGEDVRLAETQIPRGAFRLALYHAILTQVAPGEGPAHVKVSHRLRGGKHVLVVTQGEDARRAAGGVSAFAGDALRHFEQVRHLLVPHGLSMATLPETQGLPPLVLAWKDGDAARVGGDGFQPRASTSSSSTSVSPARG